MNTGRPSRARRLLAPAWERWLSPRTEQSEGGAGTRLPWFSTLAMTVLVQIGQFLASRGQPERIPLDGFGRALLFVGSAVLLVRHRNPRTAVTVSAAAFLLYLGAGYAYGPVFLPFSLACFSAIVAGYRRFAGVALGTIWVAHALLGHWLYRWLPPDTDGAADWGQELFISAWMVAIVAVSELVRVRREQAARARAERAAAERRRADEERLRIARELHDVLAHSISVINVQAGVGLALLDSDPEQARTALTTIKAASKEALGEVRQVLDTLRSPGAAPRSPAPGLDRLAELAEQARSAGLTVTVAVHGTRAQLPPGTDLAAFRIIQESLTNIVRHSGSRTARVRLTYAPDALEIRVDDDGPASGSPGTAGGGNGLVGMRERAAALGGTVESGPRPDGGFRVLARIPLEPPPGRDTVREDAGTDASDRLGSLDGPGGPNRPSAAASTQHPVKPRAAGQAGADEEKP